MNPKNWIPAIAGHEVLPVSLEAVAEKPEALAGALKAYKKAYEWMNNNPQKAAEMANTLMGVPTESARNTISTLNYNVIFSEEYVDIIRDMKELQF